MTPDTETALVPTPAPLALPEELTIYTVGELHPRWLDWLQALQAEGVTAAVDGAAVDQVDAAGLQLLLSLERALTARGATLSLTTPSSALRSACESIGLAAWLQAHEAATGESA
jgi:ABC-type transporter Mla MlaB component